MLPSFVAITKGELPRKIGDVCFAAHTHLFIVGNRGIGCNSHDMG